MHNNLFVIGINHHICSAELRSKLSISNKEQPKLLLLLKDSNIFGAILNTCNRTELYGYGNSEIAIHIFINFINTNEKIENFLIVKKGKESILHMFKVASGLDSQILGDLEILGQFKNAFFQSKKLKTLNGYLERLANTAIQSAKEIRSETNLSNGTVSMSYFVVKYIKQNFNNEALNVLIIGTGDFGKRIAYNINDYFPNVTLTLCNRTKIKSDEIADRINCNVVPFECLDEAVLNNDIIVLSIGNSNDYLINSNNAGLNHKQFIDMSIPISVNPEIKDLGHNLIGIDEISKVINQNIEIRKEHLPLANKIVEKYIYNFLAWSELFGKSDSIKYWKNIILELSKKCPNLTLMNEEEKTKLTKKYMADFVSYIKNSNYLPNDTQKIVAHFILNSDNLKLNHRKIISELFFKTDYNSCPIK